MSAKRLVLPETGGRAVKMSREEATTLLGFRRSAYAAPLRGILLKLLDEVRIHNETETATEENRLQVRAAKKLIEILFDGKVELE